MPVRRGLLAANWRGGRTGRYIGILRLHDAAVLPTSGETKKVPPRSDQRGGLVHVRFDPAVTSGDYICVGSLWFGSGPGSRPSTTAARRDK